MAELGVGYISIVPEVSKISPTVSKALQGVEPVADKSGKSMGGKIASGIGTTLKAGVIGVGAAAGAGLAASLTKGLGRLSGIENAEAKLTGLGHSASGVSSIMGDALTSVRGTAFGLEDAATIAASAVAAGIKPGQDLQRTLKLTGDAATIAGTDLSTMGSIINKVATSDMMQMDVANQMMDAGIPILQMVAEEMGVTADAAREMASDGEVSFEIFQTALEKGLGGAALASGDTVQGAFANMGAAAGRLGATLAGPFYRQASEGFGAVTDGLDSLNEKAGPAMADLEDWITGTAIPGFKELATSTREGFAEFRNSAEIQSLMAQTGLVIEDVVTTGKELGPVLVSIGSALGDASAALGVSGWQLFLTTLSGVSTVAQAVTPPLEQLSGFMEDHPGLVTAAVAAWVGFKTVPGIMEKVTGAFSPLVTRTRDAKASFSELNAGARDMQAYYQATGREIGLFDAQMQMLGTSSDESLQKMGRAYSSSAAEGGKFAHAMGAVKAGMSGIGSATMGVVNALGGPLNLALMGAAALVTSVVSANNKMDAAQREISISARDAADAQFELQAAVAGTTSGMSEEGLAAAARVATGELAGFVEQGEAMSGWMYSVETDASWWERVLGTEEWQRSREEAKQTREAYKQLETSMEELGIPMDELNRVVAEGGAEYVTLMENLRGAGDAGNQAADQLEGTRSTLDRMISDARQLDPAVAEAAAAIDVLADSSSTADEKLGGLQRMLQAMGLAPKDAEQAMWDAAEATNELVASLEGVERPAEQMGDALFDSSGALDKNNEGARELRTSLLDMAGELQNVAAQGGDVQGAFAEMDPAIQALADSFGISKDKVLELGRELGLVPDEIQVAFSMEGMEQAGQELATIWTQMQQIPPGQTIKFSAITKEAQDDLTRIGFTVEDIPNSENVAITATTEEAQAKLDGVFQQLATMDGVSVEPSVLLNTMPLVGSAAKADEILEALDIQTPTPEADIIIEKLQSGVTISQGELDYLASQTPTPIADLNKQLLDNGVSVSHEMLNALQARPTTPVLDADGRPLYAAVDSSKAKLNELQDKTVDIRIREWREYYTSGATTSTGGTSVGQHYGATGGRFTDSGFARYALGGQHLPTYAAGDRHDGYRLPASGPGTNMVDGFLAIDQMGMPTARLDSNEWVINGRSSEKYNEELKAINAGVFPKLPGYAEGGRADDILSFARGNRVGGHQASRSLEGAPYVWGGVNWGDCSGAMAALARFAVGLAPFASRFATMNQRQALSSLGFSPGLGGPGDFNLGWFNGGPYGGHTSGSIGGVNVEMGGGRGNGQIGGSAAPASHPQYTDHAHLKLSPTKVGESYTEWATPGRGATTSDPGLQWEGYSGARPEGYTPPSYGSAPSVSTSASTATRPTGSGGATASRSDAPTSWSQVAGIAASSFASGMVSDALGLFGIPDSPPALQAWAQFQDDTSEPGHPLRASGNELAAAFRGVDDGIGGLQAILGQEKALAAAGMAAQVGELYRGAMQAVVGDRPWPSTPPDAVVDLMKSLGVPGFRDGGLFRGRGGRRDDKSPALLSDGEFIVNADATDRNRGLLEDINAGRGSRPGRTEYHFHGPDAGDLLRQLEAREVAKSMQFLGG